MFNCMVKELPTHGRSLSLECHKNNTKMGRSKSTEETDYKYDGLEYPESWMQIRD